MSDTRTYWLSFVDRDRPEGQRFLGATLVDVVDYEAMELIEELDERFPNHQPGAEWIAAATRKAWRLGCNPGGEVGTVHLTGEVLDHLAHVPRNRLLSHSELVALGAVEQQKQ